MGLHHQQHAGRVLRGLEARNHLHNAKRDSHGSSIMMNIPPHFPAKAAVEKEVVVHTVVSQIYVTMTPTFSGSIAGYVTITGQVSPYYDGQSAVKSTATPTSSSINSDEAAYESAKSAAQATSPAATSSTPATDSIVASSATDQNNKSVFLNPPAASSRPAASTRYVTLDSTAIGGTPIQAAASSTADVLSGTAVLAAATVAGTPLSATRVADSTLDRVNPSMTAGAKAGLAIGLIIAFALAGGLLFFCWRRRKNPAGRDEAINEKHSSSIFGDRNLTPSDERSVHSTAGASIRSAVRSAAAATAPRLTLRPITQFLPNLVNNRTSSGNALGAAAAAAPAMSEKPQSAWTVPPQNSENPFDDSAAPISEKQLRPESPAANPFEEPEATPSAPAASEQSTVDSAEASAVAAAPVAAAAVGATAAAAAASHKSHGPNNVHRVQLDFKPSMEDELELRSGQLVRMLHEYDDGWALCVRLDRSQQGVAPRTCLSKVPVKPRPAPETSAAGLYPRPLTPTGRERAASVTADVPARKPVPGQAL